jgi:hypothetical protein
VTPTTHRSAVHEGPDDARLTAHAGLLLVGELVDRSWLVDWLDVAIDAVKPFKQRRRGLTGADCWSPGQSRC